MFTRAERIGQASIVVLALVFAVVVGGSLLGRGDSSGAGATSSPTATPSSKAPEVTFAQDTCCTQTARFLRASWSAAERATTAKVSVAPEPGFPCETTLDSGGMKGVITCQGLLKGATDYVATLSLTVPRGTFTYLQKFRTMGDRLTGVQWFTEFEDPTGEPLACAAASVRMVQYYTSGGKDPLTATQILQQGQAFNKSRDPGIDPVAIATMQKRLDPDNNYHYYRLPTREEATKSAIYWLVRSGKPVHVITLNGQHGPLVVGFTGAFGTFYDDPINAFTQVLIEDAQRGDMRPETANHRPDKYRTPGFQTGQPIGLEEWYGDEWWLRFNYPASIRMPDGSVVNIERNDGAYPTPHWEKKFVILVDDGDADNPPDREGRVRFR